MKSQMTEDERRERRAAFWNIGMLLYVVVMAVAMCCEGRHRR